MIRRMAVAAALAFGLLLGLWGLLGGQAPAVEAEAGVFYVATDGSDDDTCDSVAQRCRTIQRVLDVAQPGDEIRVAGGVYREGSGKVTIVKTVTLLGGWAPGFAVRDAARYPTTLDAEGTGRVMTIGSGLSPTIDGFVITGGDASGETTGAGRGGGIYSEWSSPIIRNNVIVGNSSSISSTSCSGGGMFVPGASASAVISGNQVLSNTCQSTSGGGGGGGLYLSGSDVLVQGNLISGNSSDKGGALYIASYGAPRIVGNEIRANEAQRNGGGIDAEGPSLPLIEGNKIVNNVAGWYAGGILIMNGPEPLIDGNTIADNAGGTCGGLLLESPRPYTVTNNVVARNQGGGIRIWDLTQYGLVAHNTVVYNTGFDGGIVLAVPYITPTVVNNIVAFNSVGIRADVDAAGTLDYNDVWDNAEQDYDLPGALQPGAHSLQVGPRFVNTVIGNYHLTSDSPCIDRGMDAGVTTDMDGHRRPLGAGYDIGADEWTAIRVFAPIVVKR
jgi:hypothetical protein